MFTPEPPLKFRPADQALADRLTKIATETDRIEGYSQPHAVAVARLAEIVATQMEMHGQDLSSLLLAALAHDLGERMMKRNYLLRPQPLTWEETLDLWRHPILGEQQAGELRLPRHAQLLIRWHHEWWNGLGYPDGLMGEAIPLGARILRVVDSYSALTADRPYREAYDPLEAEQIIADQAGIEFDPAVVQILLAYLQAERDKEEIDLEGMEGLTFENATTTEDLVEEPIVFTPIEETPEVLETAGNSSLISSEPAETEEVIDYPDDIEVIVNEAATDETPGEKNETDR